MAILICCSKCKGYFSRDKTKCPDCGANLKSSRKFRIFVKAPNGKRITHVVEGNIGFARQVEAKAKTVIALNKHMGIQKAPLLGHVWKLYLEYAKENKKSWKSDEYRWNMHIEKRLSGKKMDSITPSDIEAVLSDLRKKKTPLGKDYSPATIKHVFAIIRRLFNWAKKRDLYSGENPTKKIELPKFDNRITEFLTKREMNNLLAVTEKWPNKRAGLIVRFALFTGMRLGEILNLEWKQVDFKRGFASLADSKGIIINSIPLSATALDILAEAIGLLPTEDCPYCFPNRWGNKRTHFQKIWHRIRIEAKIPNFRFHGLRHTFATYLASSGKVDLYTLQKLLTHKSPEMTQRYAHLLDEALRNGASVADEVLSPAKT